MIWRTLRLSQIISALEITRDEKGMVKASVAQNKQDKQNEQNKKRVTEFSATLYY